MHYISIVMLLVIVICSFKMHLIFVMICLRYNSKKRSYVGPQGDNLETRLFSASFGFRWKWIKTKIFRLWTSKMVDVHCDQNDSHKITMNGNQVRQINDMRIIFSFQQCETFFSVMAEVRMLSRLSTRWNPIRGKVLYICY